MTVSAASKLDMEKFRKVHRLMTAGATEGERAAAKARAEAMAAKAGMTLKQALSSLGSSPKPQPHVFDFGSSFEDRMEAKHPGWKAQQARQAAELRAANERKRAEALARYGSKAKLFAATEREAMLEKAIAPLVSSWGNYDDEWGGRRRYAKTVDGVRATGSMIYEHTTPKIREAVIGAYLWPSTLDAALREVKLWDELWYDRTLFLEGEWTHPVEVECRMEVLRHALTSGQPAKSWEDVQARFDWKRYEFRSQWTTPQELNDPFMDRLEADIAELRRTNPIKSGLSEGGAKAAPPAQPVQNGRGTGAEGVSVQSIPLPRTNAEKRAAVLSMLDTHPDLSDREIARRVGVSPQTVNTWRKKRAAA